MASRDLQVGPVPKKVHLTGRAVAAAITVEPIPIDLRITFGDNVRAARLRLGMTQLDVAEACGLAYQYVSKIEKGAKNLTLDTMQKVAEVVGSDVSTLLRPTVVKKSVQKKQPKTA